MKTTLEESDIELIAQRVLELMRPLLVHNCKREDDTVFDVPGLCKYLKLSPKWVYEQTHLKSIPHYKLGNKQLRFKKTEIDHWTETMRSPAATEPTGKLKLVVK